MKKLAIVTINVGDAYKKIAELTHPSLKAYATKINADFIEITTSQTSTPHWEKFQLFDLLTKYERILYVDTDLIIREDCPNLFDLVPYNKIGMFNEMPFTTSRYESLMETCRAYGIKLPKWDGKYYNTGVIVLSRVHRYLFKKPRKEIFNFYEQSYINAIIAQEKNVFRESNLIYDLPYNFNRMECMDKFTGETRYASYVIHYAGYPTVEFVLELIKKDILEWSKKNYSYKKNIVIEVQGGLGDQVCAEPAIRFLANKIYQKDNVFIKTHYPILFKHLNVFVCTHEEWSPKSDTAYYRTISLPGPETMLWSFVSNLLCHTVDFCSIALLKRTLPLIDRQIHLDVNEEDLKIVQRTIGEENLKDLVLLHPGRHWESKTFPKEWWQKISDNLLVKGYKVCLIGKDEETRGVWDLDAGKAYDTRNLLDLGGLIALISKAKILISNDSAPVHIAGAFDNNIILIPSCKHPDHILPYRNGSNYYKACALFKKLMIDEYESAPTVVHEALADKIPNGSVYDYLPEPKDIVEKVKEYDKCQF